MAITKSIVKNERQNYMVHFYNDIGNFSSTIALTELIRSDETTSGTLTVGLKSILFGTNDTSIITVTRGSTGIVILNGSDFVDFSGIGLNLASSTGVTVQLNGPSWAIVELHKKSGYVEPNTNVGV
jgi:hypothetical protein